PQHRRAGGPKSAFIAAVVRSRQKVCRAGPAPRLDCSPVFANARPPASPTIRENMDIVVCIKRVPATDTAIKIAADGKSIDPAGVQFELNAYDEFALEQALRTK